MAGYVSSETTPGMVVSSGNSHKSGFIDLMDRSAACIPAWLRERRHGPRRRRGTAPSQPVGRGATLPGPPGPGRGGPVPPRPRRAARPLLPAGQRRRSQDGVASHPAAWMAGRRYAGSGGRSWLHRRRGAGSLPRCWTRRRPFPASRRARCGRRWPRSPCPQPRTAATWPETTSR